VVKKMRKKRPIGRPTKYHPDLCQDIIEFFTRPLLIKKNFKEWVNGELKVIERHVPNATPYLIDWIMKHHLSHDTPNNWSKIHPEFLGALNTAKMIQEKFLAELAIKGEHNAFMTFQALKNISGWRDKHEVESTSKSEVKITVKHIDLTDRINLLMGDRSCVVRN